MDDAQFQPEADDAKTAPARRSGVRLSDAEALATARLDMFGDNSLRDSFAAATRADGEAPIAEHGAPADEPPTVDAPAAGAGPAGPSPDPLDAAIDAAIDAVDAEHAAQYPGHAAPNAPSPPQLELAGPDRSPGPAAAAPLAYGQVSPILSALDEAERHAETERNGEAVTPALLATAAAEPPASVQEWGSSQDEFAQTRGEGGPAVDATAGSDDDAATGAQPMAMPPPAGPAAAAPPEPADAAPELPAMPAFDFSPPFPDSSVGTASSELSRPPFREELAPPAPMLDTAAQIAAEANATADALENLKHLLGQRPDLPPLEPGYRPDHGAEPAMAPLPRVDSLRLSWQPEAAQFPGTAAVPLPPLPLPPEPRSGKGVYVLGFLTGLGLSLMTGLVLYLVINPG